MTPLAPFTPYILASLSTSIRSTYETVIAYFVLTGKALVGQLGLAYKDSGPQIAITGIEERIERVGTGRLRDDDIVPKVSVQQTCCKELDGVGIVRNDNLPLYVDAFRVISVLDKSVILRPALCQQRAGRQKHQADNNTA